MKEHDQTETERSRKGNLESYMYKMAKELLYAEIERNDGFCGKLDDGEIIRAPLIKRDDYRHECVLMEFPTPGGYYPDETLCETSGCRYSKHPRVADGFRFNAGNGYCACASCKHLMPKEKYIIHDIAAFWKGYVVWAIEIVNKHEPDWKDDINHQGGMPYPVYVVKAENVLKRVTDTPVFIDDIIGRQ